MGRELTIPQVVERVWGREQVIVNNRQYCGKLLLVDAGACSEYHGHKKKMETLYCLVGKVEFQVEGERLVLEPGQALTILPKEMHSFGSLEAATLIEFSTHHSDAGTVFSNWGKRGQQP